MPKQIGPGTYEGDDLTAEYLAALEEEEKKKKAKNLQDKWRDRLLTASGKAGGEGKGYGLSWAKKVYAEGGEKGAKQAEAIMEIGIKPGKEIMGTAGAKIPDYPGIVKRPRC